MKKVFLLFDLQGRSLQDQNVCKKSGCPFSDTEITRDIWVAWKVERLLRYFSMYPSVGMSSNHFKT